LSDATVSLFGQTGGWDEVHLGELVVHHVPGYHSALLEASQAETVADVVRKRLATSPN